MFLLLQWRHRVTTWGNKMTAVLSIAAKIGDNTIWQGSKNAKLTTFLKNLSAYPQSHMENQP